MADGSNVAFFEAPDEPFDFKDQHDFDLHLALEVDRETLERMFERGLAEGIETRGIADHGFVHSIYFRDPNGYVVELASPVAGREPRTEEDAAARSHEILDGWQAAKP